MVGVRGLAAIFAVAVAWAIGATNVAAAESPDAVWREVREVEIPRSPRAREIVPQHYRAFGLNRARLAQLLAQAPHERSRRPSESAAELQLPMPDGTYDTFRIVESPVMEPGLAAKYPEIRTWLGQGVDDPTATVRFDLTPRGFHAQVISSEGTVYVDPYQPGDVDHYIAYHKRDHVDDRRMICEVTGEEVDAKSHVFAHAKLASGGTLRTYRLAVAATGEFTQYHGGTVVDGLAAIVTTMNRVNGLYEREVAVRMVLVATNDLIIFTDPATDPYTNTSSDLNANQTAINSRIGAANYDIGHLVGTGGGGVAQLGSVCGTSKARGLTGNPAPVADGFDVDYVAHEMGHQFNGLHTFNGSGLNCAPPNRSAPAAYEPGSGITIQAYAGICGLDNLQPNSEDYFHRVSLNEILTFTTTGAGGTCGTTPSTGNAAPTVTTTAAFTIPSGTPFALTAVGSDANGDALTYIWEQFDLGATPNAEGVLNPAAPNGPLFRSFVPSTSPSRVFPSLRYILNNANVVPATAPLPGTTTPVYFTGEALPTAARTLDFRVTVRDNRAGGGGTNEAATQLTVVSLPAPFAVTSPNTAVTLAAGFATTVTWNFLGTQIPPINAANVKISLSTDGGYTFPHVLAESTANDGTESVPLPAITTTQARIKIEAVGNIFFDISDANFTMTTSGNTPPSITVTGSVTTRQGSPTASAVVATVSDVQDQASALSVSVSGAPSELTVSVQNVNGSVTLSATADCSLVTPTNGNKVYPVVLSVTDSGGGVRSAEVNVNVGANRTPTLGAYPTLNAVTNQTRLATPDQLGADANGNFSGASVTPTTLPGGGTVSIAADGVVTVVTGATTPNGTYTIRPTVTDTCGAAETRQFSVVVGDPQISLVVASTRVSTGNGLLEPNECNDVFVSVRNNGNIPATGVDAVVSTTNPNVTIRRATSAYPDIPPGEARDNALAFQIESTNQLTCFSNVDLGLSVTYSGGAGSPFAGTASVPVGRALAQNYTFTTSTGTLPATSLMTLVSGSQQDDGLVDLVVPAGFAFSIYDTAVNGGATLRASSNGNLQFRSNQGATDAGNSTLPAAGAAPGANSFPAAAATLFLQWDDWRLDAADTVNVAPDAGIYTRLEGTAPNRTWIVEWRGRVRGDGAVATNNNRAAIVFREGSDSFDYVYALTGVNAAANAAGATIGVQAASTGTRFTQFAFNNANLAPGTKLTASRLPAICSAGSGGCVVVPPGVSVTQSDGNTTVAEGAATDTYSIVLTSQPSGNVTIAVAPDAQLTTSGNLTFTSANWNVAQNVTVTAVDDAVAEGAHSGTITHTASGGGYTGVAVAGVTATIGDNDTAGVTLVQSGGSTIVAEGGSTDTYTLQLTSQPTGTVTISVTPNAQLGAAPAPVTFDATDWNTLKTVTVSAVDDAVAEGAHTGAITHAASGGGYDAVPITGVTASIGDNDTTGVTITQSDGGTAVAEGAATDTYTIVLTSQPTAGVTVSVSPEAQLSTSGNVSFTTADWNSPKTVTVTAVDDAVAEGAHNGAITHSATGGGYDGVTIAGVTATIGDNDTAGVVVNQSGGTTSVSEGGAGDSYTLVLTSQPTGTVTITVTPNAQVGVAPPSVSFDSTDWSTPKTVAVSAVDDGVEEGPHSGAITHGAVGGGYDAVAIGGVTVSIADNDSAGDTPVDLAVANMLTNAPVLAGKRMAWEVAVENLTAGVNVASAQFTFTLSPLLTNVAWVCVGEAGSVCPANGTGAPNHAIALNGGTGVSYVITADVPAGTAVGTPIDTLATITVATPADAVPTNNQAATSHLVGTEFIFSDGFENPAAGARARLGLD
ncbi:MAG TPA: zinc-dependent metalloprotease family protein [Candidatus Saccharimonadia bacterium]|nr:zinc-dependent metalloprotease family protein [Candidatus Saccharimonadia bacterium]